jgi:hypothetical protein
MPFFQDIACVVTLCFAGGWSTVAVRLVDEEEERRLFLEVCTK